MIKQTLLVALLVSAFSIPAMAADKAAPKATVSKTTLENAGLTSMKPMSDTKGKQVRGQGGAALTMGMSFVSGMLIDPKTKSYVYGVDANHAQACLDTSCIIGLVDPTHTTQSQIQLGLEITDIFKGVIVGGAGGGATAFVH